MIRRTIIVTALLLLTKFNGICQLSNPIQKSKSPFYITGNLTSGVRSFRSNNYGLNRNSKIGYLANINLNIHIFDFVLPFSYRLGDQVNHPSIPSFQYWGFSPKYKSLQLHVGHRSLFYSKNTLAGMQSYGLGIDLNLKSFRFKLSRGILNRRQDRRTLYGYNLNQRKERTYTAGQLRLGKRKNYFKWDVLVANEKNQNQDTLSPRFNLVNECTFRLQISSLLRLESNAALSYVDNKNQDFYPIENDHAVIHFIERLGRSPNLSSKVGFLYSANLTLEKKGNSLSLEAQQIDLGFETFGRNFQVTDLRAYTVKGRLGLFKRKVYLTSKIGWQFNNLQNLKSSNTSRIVSNINLSIRPNKSLQLQINASNFSIEKENIFVVGQDSFSFNYNALISSFAMIWNKKRSTFSWNTNYSKNSNTSTENTQKSSITLINGAFDWTYLLTPKGRSAFSLGCNYTSISQPSYSSEMYGISLAPSYHDKSVNIRLSYAPLYQVKSDAPNFISHQLNARIQYLINKSHKLFLTAYYQKINDVQNIQENQFRLGYSWTFNTKKQ